MDVARIPLRARDGSVRAYALVDDADFGWLNEWRWCLGREYAVRLEGRKPNRRTIYMHKEIARVRGCEVDHVNEDKLDNRRENLRRSTHGQNHQNKGLAANNTSGYRGVSLDRPSGKWKASAKLHGRTVSLGRFTTPELAHQAISAWRAEHMPFSADARVAV